MSRSGTPRLRGNRNPLGSMTDTNLLTLITVVVFFVMYLCAICFLQKGFLKPQTLFNMLSANAALIILSCGLSLVMITGGIDISVGGVTALVATSSAVYMDMHGGNVFVALLISLGIGLLFGIVQGYLVAFLEIQPFIVTLAGMFFARGMTTIINSVPFDVKNEQFVGLKNARITIPFLGSYNKNDVFVNAKMELGVLVAVAVVIVMFIFLKWTKTGRSFYAVGGNRQSALMLGINVRRTRFLSHLICGLLAGLGGFIFLLHVGSGSPMHGEGYEMDAIASSIIGGTMLTGGVGNIVGTFFGVMSLSLIQNIVSSLGYDRPWWPKITVAAMLCFFLIIQSIIIAQRKRAITTANKQDAPKEVKT